MEQWETGRRQRKRLLATVGLAFVGGLGAAAGARGAQFEVERFLARYVESHRVGDRAALLAMHTQDSEFVIPGQNPIRGESALRDLFDWDAVLGAELEVAGGHLEGATLVLGAIVERNAFFRGLGIDAVRYQPGTELALVDDRIAATRLAPLVPESEAAVVEGLGALLGWLERAQPQLVGELLPDGKFRYDGGSARSWLGVLALWRQATGGGDALAAQRLGRELMRVWASGETGELSAIVAPDAIYEENVNGERFAGVEGFARYVGHVHDWGGDVEMEVLREATAGEAAVFEWRFTATQERPVSGALPVVTGRRVVLRGATVVEARDGRIVRAADYLDGLAFVLALGARLEFPGGGVLERPAADE